MPSTSSKITPTNNTIGDHSLSPVFFKVVTEGLQSLGLKGNTNIMTFPINQWVFEPNPIEGEVDEGGIWCAHTPGIAKSYVRYMDQKHNRKAHIFYAEVGKILWRNHRRIKVDSLCLTQELF